MNEQSEPAAESPYAAFAVYGALDDVALAALGNRGLLRRGRAELAAGRVEPGSGPAGTNAVSRPVPEAVTIRVGRPPFPVTLTSTGPQDARCPCPVAGICLHVLAACLWMREAVNHRSADHDAANEATCPPPPQGAPTWTRIPTAPARESRSDPVLEEVLTWDPVDVSKSLGAEARRRVQTSLAGFDPAQLAAGTEVTSAPGRLSITWSGAPEVVVLAGLGPRGMIVSGRHSPAANAAWRLQAVIRLFARAGRYWPWPDEETVLSDHQRNTLSAVSHAIETIVSTGISHAGPRSADDLERLAQMSRLEELPRLSRLLTSAAWRLRALAERDDAVDEAAVLSVLAAAWSLTRALADPTGPADPALIGRVDTEVAETGLLLPLSATWWTAPSGSRGLTIRLWDLDNGRPESVTTGRAAGVDAAFRYSQDATLLWGTSVKNILSGPLRLTGAARRPDGTLAPSSRTAVTRRSGEAGYDDVDLEAVAGHLQQIGSGPEEARFEVPVPRIRLIMVAEDGLGPIDIDEVHQHYLWPVTGTDGCRHLLSMEVGGREMQMVSDVRSRELQVCAITVEDCRPTGIFVREYDRICLLTATYPPSRSVSNLGFRRQRRRKEQIQRRTPTQAPDKIATDRSPMQVLAQDVHEALTALAASGTMRPTGMVSHVLRTRARLADDLQLTTLAAALNELDSRPSPGAVLLACAVVDRIDALTR
mgnify:FL=1